MWKTNKIVFFRSLVGGCATIMQFLMVGIVFYNDNYCRIEFTDSNSIMNQVNCIASLKTVPGWNCKCEYFGSTIATKYEQCGNKTTCIKENISNGQIDNFRRSDNRKLKCFFHKTTKCTIQEICQFVD